MTDAASAAAKTDALANTIAAKVVEKAAPGQDALIKALAGIATDLKAVQARLVMLENSMPSASAGKRQVRTGAATSATAAKKGAERKTPANSRLYFVDIVAHEDAERAKICTADNMKRVEAEKGVVAKAPKKDTPAGAVEYWKAVGNALWAIVLTDGQKAEYKAKFDQEKAETAANAVAPALEDDGTEDLTV